MELKPQKIAAAAPTLGGTLTRARLRQALTENELARIVGVRRESVSHWEHGRKLPALARIRNCHGPGPLAAALDLDWRELAALREAELIERRRRRIVGE